MKIKKPAPNKVSNNSTNSGTNKNIQKSYIVVPYYSGLSESIKKIGSKYGMKVYSKGCTTIKDLLMAPKDKDLYRRKLESSTDTNVTGWSVKKSTLKSPQKLLEKGSKNI